MEAFNLYPVVSYSLVFTNYTLYLLAPLLFTIYLFYYVTSGYTGKLVRLNSYMVLGEAIFHTLYSMVVGFIGSGFSSTRYLPLIFTIFTLVFFSNFTGLIPYSTTPTTELVLTLGVSFTMLLGILVMGVTTHRAKLVAAFIPAGTPLGLMPLMILLEMQNWKDTMVAYTGPVRAPSTAL